MIQAPRRHSLVGAVLVATAVGAILAVAGRSWPAPAPPSPFPEPAMQIASPAFRDGEFIPRQYTCDGENVSPPLNFSDAPSGAVTLALVLDDPDAPRGDWVHWLVWNIAPATVAVSERTAPPGATEGTTDFSRPGYGGPCPPTGVHRYVFKLYALDAALALDARASRADLRAAMRGHILAEASLVGRYERRP